MTATSRRPESLVAVTGAAGSVARQLLPGLVDRYRLRLADLRAAGEQVPAGTEWVEGDLADPQVAAAVCADADTVVHLAATPSFLATWDELRHPNVEALVGVLQAARDAGVRRVVLASSVHAMGGYVTDARPVDPAWPPAPCCAYGATKAFAEALGSYYAGSGGPSVVALRFGAVNPRPGANEYGLSWLAPVDLRQLVVGAIEADVDFVACFGVSANTGAVFDVGLSERALGYRPVEDAARHVTLPPPGGPAGVCATASGRPDDPTPWRSPARRAP